MKATDFNLSRDLRLNVDTGIATFLDARLVIFDANAIGSLRQSMIDEIGWEKTRDILLRFGYQNGYADHMQMRVNYDFDNDMELLKSGPRIHSWEGKVLPVPGEFLVDRAAGTFSVSGVWENSYEAQQFLCYNPPADETVCWSLCGYAAGYNSAFLGKPVLHVETHCVGKGDARCAFIGGVPSDFGPEGDVYRAAFEQFWK